MSADSDATLPDAGCAGPNASQNMASQTASTAAARRKPRFALFVATACGLGYLPVAPGTWGSLAGVGLTALFFRFLWYGDSYPVMFGPRPIFVPYPLVAGALALLIAFLGVRIASRAAEFAGAKDPQFVVIDEVSGQLIALLLGAGETMFQHTRTYDIWPVRWHGFVNWKYLLLGFILFRVFDIWKPFPARQAESLPGGWGIMADDWVAGIYAAIGLWLARAAGL